MKLVYEIDVDKIELSVIEAVDILNAAIHRESHSLGRTCGVSCSDDPYFLCTRGMNHEGRHMATGGGQVYDIWKDK